MGKEIYCPHELISSSSFPETLMDFILINDEAWALQAQRGEGGELGAGSLERRRNRRL